MKSLTEKQMQIKIIQLENAVFKLMQELKHLEKCESCEAIAKNINESDLIFDTGLCVDCYQSDYVEGE